MGVRRFRALLRGMPLDAAWLRALAEDEASADQDDAPWPPPDGGGSVVRVDFSARRQPDAAAAEAMLRDFGGLPQRER